MKRCLIVLDMLKGFCEEGRPLYVWKGFSCISLYTINNTFSLKGGINLSPPLFFP